ncbi:hypothetical protein GCM10023115_07870 [Pontixanthobacter gangjinensis]|uniref:Uncharacterized protein n=1 Tax=Pontixanthobacter gangjinensis TaxID=1028742 RepID=A0A6I4SK28_9SPHN|nr:hypothetical protein [Pontixanthobacter gangjinensis]MXO56035.1 hypothetical protein [Pontixanthobacter gangjinensis]
MTLSSSIFRNFSAITLALLYTVFTFGVAVTPAPVQAKTQPVYYIAELAAPTQEARVVARGMVWRCDETRCIAAKNNSRPINICKQLVRETGAVTSFTASGEAFSDDELAKCNG